MPWRWDRRRLQADQAASATDQTSADKDQTASDTDQSVSDRDQEQAEIDQLASERDQAASDRDLAGRDPVDPETERTHELSRIERAKGTLDRSAGTLVRAQVSLERNHQANERDVVARKRDRVAEERDRVAEKNDREIRRREEDLGSHVDPRAAQALEALAEMRDKAAAQRMQAAADRARAARDREAAADDRLHLFAELERVQMDELTGAYGRGMGKIALVNEIERARRSGALALAYIDCDNLKEVNDRDGHAAGDGLLRDLVSLVRSKLRLYDPIVRWGGDEFLCAISGADPEDVRGRLEEIRGTLAEEDGPRVTVGVATLADGDTLESLVERADAALLDARLRR